jgi:YVTN family beta-propeller protein
MSARAFDFRVLGPLEVWLDGELVALGGPKQRALLALLLLNANRVVSRARLIADLLGEPADADRVLRVQISRLRKALEDGEEAGVRLITRPPGYLLRVEDGELDLHRFDALVVEGRHALERGRYEPAIVALRAAESLWRGRALDGLESEPFAVGEIARLDGARLAAAEERIDAELGLGRHGRLVPELEALVGEHPLREHLRWQLMLALYRSDRQAEALEAYRKARAVLSDELALEPGPALRSLERAILCQDAALDLAPVTAEAPAAPMPAPAPDRDPVRRRWRRVASLLAAMLAVATTGIVLLGSRERATPRAIAGNALALLPGAGGAPIASTNLDARPTRIASGAGAVWVTHVDAGTVSRIDPITRTVRQTIRVGDGAFGVAVAAGDVWVANSLDGTVSRIDAATDAVVQTIAVGAQPSAVAAWGRDVFVANRGDDTLVRLDAVTGRVTAVLDTGNEPSDVVVVRDTVWVSNQGDGTVSRIDAPSGDRLQTIEVGDGPSALAAGRDGLWVVNSLDATVSRVETLRGVVTATIAVGGRPAGVSAFADSIWVSDLDAGRVVRIDARRSAVRNSIVVGERAGPMIAGPGGLWVGMSSGGARHRGGTLRIAAARQEVPSLDPALIDDVQPAALLGLTNDGLVTLNHVGGPEGGQLVPDLALALPSASDGRRTYTFRLRPGIRYSTGRMLRPRDVRRSFERVFEVHSAGRSNYDRIVGAAACRDGGRCDLSRGIVVGDRGNSVAFHLVSPDSDFLYKLTLPYAFILPASTLGREARSPLPATGPYVIASFKAGRELRLRRNPRFHVWSATAQPAGYPDQIVWRLGLRPRRAVLSVAHGQADLVSDIGGPPSDLIDELRTRFRGQIHTNPAMGTDFFFLNTRVKPFNDVRVRRALNYAIDRTRIVAIYGGPGTAVPTCQILPPQMPGFRRTCPYTRDPRSDGRWRTPDVAKARRLIAASSTRGMAVDVWDTPTPANAREQGRYVTALLRRLGYRASLHLLPDREFLRYTDDSRNHAQVVAGGWGADYPSPSSLIGRLTCSAFISNSTSTYDNSQFCDPRIDRQIARAQVLQTTDRRRAIEAWERLDREITNRAIWLPTVTGTLTDIVSKRVGNYQFHAFWGVLADQLWVR